MQLFTGEKFLQEDWEDHYW
jgi:hypothetical protein